METKKMTDGKTSQINEQLNSLREELEAICEECQEDYDNLWQYEDERWRCEHCIKEELFKKFVVQ